MIRGMVEQHPSQDNGYYFVVTDEDAGTHHLRSFQVEGYPPVGMSGTLEYRTGPGYGLRYFVPDSQ